MKNDRATGKVIG
jgi:hypothetical protein